MGLVVCEKHGTGFVFVCPHVARTVSTNSACDPIRYLEFSTRHDAELADLNLGGWFCSTCIDERQLPTDGVVADVDSFLDDTSDIFGPMCPGCFNEWETESNAVR